jgi:hypothetical protein
MGSVHDVVKRSGTVYLIIVALVLVLALTNWWMGTSSSNTSDAKKQAAPADLDDEAQQHVQLPDPKGSPDARVKVHVYVTSDNTCDTTTLSTMEDLYSKFGEQIYIIYSDLLDADVLKDAQDHKISCKTGITINGKSQFILPERGLKGTVMLDGPTGQKNYDNTDIEAIVQHILDTPELDEPKDGTPSDHTEKGRQE